MATKKVSKISVDQTSNNSAKERGESAIGTCFLALTQKWNN